MSESLPPIFDSHAHLDDRSFDADRTAMLDRARLAGVRGILNIAYRPDIWEASVALREAHPDVELAAGIHPQDADSFETDKSDALAGQLLALRPRAIGEAGFDFFRPGPTLSRQQMAFRWQIELAISADLPLIIHQRDASKQLIEELDRWPNLKTVVLHSFDGDRHLAAWAIERGFHVGIGGLACRPGSRVLREAIQTIPVEYLLLETDAPYLAPPGSGSRRNEPANLPLVAEKLAPLWELTPEALCRRTTANARAIFFGD